jgi:hypothetical protein
MAKGDREFFEANRAVRALLKTQAPAVLALVDKELGR